MVSLPPQSGIRTMAIYAVILAGGLGTRLAPLSTPERPKQFLPLHGTDSLLQQTYARLLCEIAPEHIVITTNQQHVDIARSQLPQDTLSMVTGEPHGRNTLPAVTWVAQQLVAQDPTAVLYIVPADHFIGDAAAYAQTMRLMIATASAQDVLVTCGIEAKHPSSDYGYIRCGEVVTVGQPIYQVRQFIEKPTREYAARLSTERSYVWNSGMFCWRARVWLEEIAQYQIAVHQLVHEAGNSIERFFTAAPNISIDYGVLEHTTRAVVCTANFPWSDLGSFDTLRRLHAEGVIDLTLPIPPTP
jgi:mannose-1-phosphate guanylyltransferase